MERTKTVAAALAACAVALASALATARAEDKPELPDGAKGFRGVLKGKVVSAQDDGRGFRVAVAEVAKLWKENKATAPKDLVGKTVLVNAQWEKAPGDGGEWRPVEAHVRFVKSLKVDEEIEIEVVNDEGERLHIVELTEAQRAREPAGEDKPRLPEGVKGFSGLVRGRVVSRSADGKSFRLQVAEVLKLWKGNKAKKPKEAVGEALLVNAQWEKGEDGAWRPVEAHVRFVKSLKVDEEIEIEVVNDEGERLHVLELSKEQRERAGRE